MQPLNKLRVALALAGLTTIGLSLYVSTDNLNTYIFILPGAVGVVMALVVTE